MKTNSKHIYKIASLKKNTEDNTECKGLLATKGFGKEKDWMVEIHNKNWK